MFYESTTLLKYGSILSTVGKCMSNNHKHKTIGLQSTRLIRLTAPLKIWRSREVLLVKTKVSIFRRKIDKSKRYVTRNGSEGHNSNDLVYVRKRADHVDRHAAISLIVQKLVSRLKLKIFQRERGWNNVCLGIHDTSKNDLFLLLNFFANWNIDHTFESYTIRRAWYIHSPRRKQ